MATYFHHHHHQTHHGNTSDMASDGGLQTLILMNHPNFATYSESHAPTTLYHAPPQILPQLVGVPLNSSSEPYASYGTWAQRESPRAQQGLSLTLSRAAETDHLQPSPAGGSSESPAANVASAGDVAALMTPSKYLKAAQELLEEVVSVSVDRARSDNSVRKVKTPKGESPPVDDSLPAPDGPKEPVELAPADRQELQMKKAKLMNLLEEVEQRQRQYQQQMQTVVASFEQVAGPNSARTYTSLALKTISSQFRCLRGAISGQIRAANKALGEGEAEGGPTSRLKMLDHQMRQQRALQQLGMIQNNAWRPQRGLPEKAVSVLRAWLFEHFLHPYPKDSDKIMLAKQTGLSRSQVSNWFINARVRLWKPMIEEMYAEEVKEHQQQNSTDNKDQPDDGHEDHNLRVGDEKANAGENHSSSNVKGNNDPFALVDNEAQGSCLKKQRSYDFTFPDSEMFNNGCKEEQVVHHHQTKQDDDCPIMPGSGSGFMGGLGSYPMGQIGRFDENGQFPANFSGNGVSLTLGLPHCESLSLQGNNQAYLANNSGIDQYRGRLEMGQLNPSSSHSGNAYGAQLLHDFVA